MGPGPRAQLHPPLLHSNRQGHLRSGGLRPHSRRPQVRGLAVQKTTQQTTQTQVQVRETVTYYYYEFHVDI